MKWFRFVTNRFHAQLGVVVIATVFGCTDERGLILRGDVLATSVADGDIWLGVWGESTLQSAPLVATRLVDEIAKGAEGANPFLWQTGVRFSVGQDVYLAAYVEPLHGDGLPDNGVPLFLADQEVLNLTSENLESVGNGAYEYKESLVISFVADLVSTREILEEGYRTLQDSFTTVPLEADKVKALIHPMYRDAYLRNYVDAQNWLTAQPATGTAVEWPSLAGYTSSSFQDSIVNPAMPRIAAVTFADTERAVHDVVLQYTRRDNNIDERIVFGPLPVIIENQKPRFASFPIVAVTLQQDTFAMEISSASDVIAFPHEFSWDAFSNEASYVVALDRWDGDFWQAVTFASGISSSVAGAYEGVLQENCDTVTTYDVCLYFEPVSNTNYRLRVAPDLADFAETFASWQLRVE